MTDPGPKSSTRIYVILARKAPCCSRVPTRAVQQVLTIAWNTQTHEFCTGQWFKGRIYEHRSDLSPSGEKLIYFAAKHRAPLFADRTQPCGTHSGRGQDDPILSQRLVRDGWRLLQAPGLGGKDWLPNLA